MAKNQIMIYAAIVIIVAVVVLSYAFLHNPSSYSISISMRSITPLNNLYPLQTQVLQTTLKNTGGSKIQNMSVVLYINNTVLGTYSVTIPSGATALINTTYTYEEPGNYTFDMVADPASVLNIQDRQAAHSTINASVGTPQSPNAYLYSDVPNIGIKNLQSFELETGGITTAIFLVSNYNISLFSHFTFDGQSVIQRIFQDTANQTNLVDGTYITYNDSSTAYEAWIQSTYSPYAVSQITGSFGLTRHNQTIGNSSVAVVNLNKNTTLCYYYYGGWTKLFAYTNQNTSETCATVLQKTYTPEINGTLVQALKDNPDIAAYQSYFHYTNSSSLGSSVLYSNGSIGALNLFVQPTYSIIFGSLVQKKPLGVDIAISTNNFTCTGLTYSVNGVKTVCSTVVVPRTGTFGASYTLLNSTEITSNYIVSLYSLMNTSNVELAYQNSGRLIQYLNASGTIYPWGSIYQNKCAFANTLIGCSVSGFNFTSKTASFQITNQLGKQIKLNQIACYIPNSGSESNYTVNQTLAVDAYTTVNTICNAAYIPNTFGYISDYTLILNYSLNGMNKYVVGIANLTSLQEG